LLLGRVGPSWLAAPLRPSPPLIRVGIVAGEREATVRSLGWSWVSVREAGEDGMPTGDEVSERLLRQGVPYDLDQAIAELVSFPR
jgi:hypothetical protein